MQKRKSSCLFSMPARFPDKVKVELTLAGAEHTRFSAKSHTFLA
jgi:hypothetical protein